MESRLWGLREGEDWHNLCMTAPITINGITFEHPEYCVRTVSDAATPACDRMLMFSKGNTMHAYWKVPDLKCIVHG